ncbi:Zn-dependent protease [Motilibacter peucedani]|uniref:Zn-dependent protease n=1 Tax=Motilibacter peucedani TaxID=598650 RepID=A0A420XTE9_9ACTN|nr:M50 family metallopeptidase [Motilibacter peucedani]RKS80108.1 Zn-dependent protease [Motilibacter peucedani]
MRIFGFPLRVSPLLPVVLLALGQGGGSTAGLVAFVVGGVVAILVHELGHAFAARAAGAREIEIALVALGGVTTYVSPPQSRWSRIGIAVAGPLTGVAIGVPLLAVRLAGDFSYDTARVLESLVFVTLGWAVLNLLPVRPFDGGHVLESALPGSEPTRVRLASAISVVFALAVAAWAYQRSTWTAGMFLVVAVINLLTLLPERRRGSATSAEERSYAVVADVVAGRLDAARTTASAGRVDASVQALLAGLGDPGAATRLEGLVAERPDPLRRTSLLVWAVTARDWERAVSAVAGGPLPVDVVVWAMGAARTSGQPRFGAALGQAALPWTKDPQLAYLTARCWGAAGAPERAYDGVVYATTLGLRDLSAVADEPDLAAMRRLPAWAAFAGATDR